MERITLRDGSVTQDRRLDRLISFDERSRNFPAVRSTDPLATFPLRSFSWSCNAWLDQGQQGSCVGHAWAHELSFSNP
jgi:hypothetical protein